MLVGMVKYHVMVVVYVDLIMFPFTHTPLGHLTPGHITPNNYPTDKKKKHAKYLLVIYPLHKYFHLSHIGF